MLAARLCRSSFMLDDTTPLGLLFVSRTPTRLSCGLHSNSAWASSRQSPTTTEDGVCIQRVKAKHRPNGGTAIPVLSGINSSAVSLSSS